MTTQATQANLLMAIAWLLANYDGDRDYLANFEPFVIDRLKDWPAEEEVRPKALCKALSTAYHLPKIPINTVTQLRDRALRRRFLYRDQLGRCYPNFRELATVKSLSSQKTIFLEHFDRLARNICAYATEVHDRPWTIADAERALVSFSEEFSVEMAMARRTGGLVVESPSRRNEELAVVHGFARRALERDQESLDYLEEVVQASMLANVVYLQDLGSWKPDLGGLVVYLDTTVAFRVLGLTEGEVAEATNEMMDMLDELGVPVRVFDHTVAEMKGVLQGVRDYLREDSRGRTNLGFIPHRGMEVLTHALHAGWGPADAEEARVELEARLGALGIAVAATPAPGPTLRLDERGLERRLEEARFTPAQRLRDVESLTAVHVLRDGRSASELGRARAIFVSHNELLVKAARGWFSELGRDGGVPQCMTETSFTTQLWLRSPKGRPDVARKFLVAESYAALNPSPELWERYLDRIAQRRDREEITEQQVRALVFSTEAKESLAEVAHGDPDRIDDEAIGEVLARSQEFLPADLARELEDTHNHIESLRDDSRSMKEEISERDRLLEVQADRLEAQNQQIVDLQESLGKLLHSDAARAKRERRARKCRLIARRAAGCGLAAIFVLAALGSWLFAGIETGLVRAAIGFAGTCLAIGSLAIGFSKDLRWVGRSIVFVGALPALFFGLASIDDDQAPDPPPNQPQAGHETGAGPTPKAKPKAKSRQSAR
jgi:hypothetical protein